jgi:hypothetical protein
MDRQQINNQKGEIEFRRKLVRQQIKGDKVLSDEYEGSEGENILRDRMNETLAGMNRRYLSGYVAQLRPLQRGIRQAQNPDAGMLRC